VWLALGLSVIGSVLLAFPAPFLALAKAGPDVADKVRGYLTALAFSLPGSLLFTVYRALNTAVSRPKAVMLLQMGALAIKVPLSTALVFGVPAIGLPAMGVTGCGISTAVAVWSQVIAAMIVLRRDPFYARFQLLGHGLHRPDWKAIRQQLRLGLPLGAAILIEVTGFSFMALFIARLGTTPVAGHQIAVNLVSMMFMMPLAVGSATSTLVAQSVGAGAQADARRLALHGLVIGCGLATVLGAAVYFPREAVVGLYTRDATIIAAALPLMALLVVFHVADAAQTVAAFVLRAFKIATVPMVIYVAALWGVGLGGGYLLAFDVSGTVPPALHGARGFWMASTLGLLVAALALTGFMLYVFCPAAPRTCARAGPASPKPLGSRQRKNEAAAAAFGARLATHAAPMALGDLPHKAQAQADAAFFLGMPGETEKGFEDSLAPSVGHARAAVADPHFHLGAMRFDAEFDLLAAIATGVFQQVPHGAAQEPFVALHAHVVALHLSTHTRAFFGGQGEQIHRIPAVQCGSGVQTAGQQHFFDQRIEFCDVGVDLAAQQRSLCRRDLIVFAHRHSHLEPGQG
jgi:MATE family multidrug resistance protein